MLTFKRSRMGSALMAASFQGYAKAVEKLPKAGGRINHAIEAGGTAWMFAVLSSRTELVRLLFVNGAQANTRDWRGLCAAVLAEQRKITSSPLFFALPGRKT